MLLDIHCHLTDAYFNDKILSIVKDCESNDIGIVITAGLNPNDNRKVIRISKKFKIINASLGFYPIDAIKFNEETVLEEIDYIKKNKNKICAISEVGLDYFYSKEKTKQKKVFEEFIQISERLSLPIIVHSRSAEEDTIEMLQSSSLKSVVFHSFGGNKNLIKKIIDQEWYFSIPPVIVRSSNFQTLVKLTPISQLLTESDSPYQSPYKNKKNNPVYVKEAVKKISEIKNFEYQETSNIIFANFQKIFKKWKTI